MGLTNFLAKHAGAAAVGSASRRTLLPQPLLALFILALLAIAFYWDVLFTNRAIFPWDAFDFFYPLLSYVHEELQQLRMPLWNPYLFGGFPIIADPEAQIFYPPNWFFLLLHPFSPLSYRWVEAQIVAHYVLAGAGMFYLARDLTRDFFAALLAALLYMFSGVMVEHAEHLATVEALAWYPLVFRFARRGLLENDLRATLLAGVFFAAENLAGHWQHSVYLGLFLFLYFAYEACAGLQRKHLWPAWIGRLALIAAVGAGMAMVQILPTWELSRLSIRSYVDFWDVTYGNQPAYLLTLFLPNYYGGLNGVPYREAVEPSMNYVFLTVPGCMLAIAGLIEFARQRNFFWVLIIAVCSDISLGLNGLLGRYIYDVPILNWFRQTQAYFDVANFALCVAAAVGAHALVSKNATRRFQVAVLLLSGVLVAAAAVLTAAGAVSIPGWWQMVIVLGLFFALLALLVVGLIPVHATQMALLALSVFQIFANGRNQIFNHEQANPQTALTPSLVAGNAAALRWLRTDNARDFRIAAFAEWPWNNGASVFRIPGIFAWNPLELQRYDEYLRQFAIPYSGPDPQLASPPLDLLGVKYVLVQNEQRAGLAGLYEPKFEKVWEQSGWGAIYRNRDYLSRAAFYDRAYVLPNDAAVRALMSSRWFTARRALLFSKEHLRTMPPLAVELPAVEIAARRLEGATSGVVGPDIACAAHIEKLRGWRGPGAEVRFRFGELPAGRYALAVEYVSAGDAPALVGAELRQSQMTHPAAPVSLPRTLGTRCRDTRTAALGEFEISASQGEFVLKLANEAAADLYRLWLIRLPERDAEFDSEFLLLDYRSGTRQIDMEMLAPHDGYLLFSEVNYPGWRARIDGREAEILTADSLFRALYVGAGRSRIELWFWPRYLILGGAISLGAVCALLFLLRKSRAVT